MHRNTFPPFMANELPKNGGETDHLDEEDPTKPGPGPGKASVSVAGIVLVSVYLVLAIIFCLYGLLVFWPAPTPSGGPPYNRPRPLQLRPFAPNNHPRLW